MLALHFTFGRSVTLAKNHVLHPMEGARRPTIILKNTKDRNKWKAVLGIKEYVMTTLTSLGIHKCLRTKILMMSFNPYNSPWN